MFSARLERFNYDSSDNRSVSPQQRAVGQSGSGYLRRAAGRARARARARRAARGWAAAAAAAGSACAARRARCSPRPLHTNTYTGARIALAHTRRRLTARVRYTRAYYCILHATTRRLALREYASHRRHHTHTRRTRV